MPGPRGVAIHPDYRQLIGLGEEIEAAGRYAERTLQLFSKDDNHLAAGGISQLTLVFEKLEAAYAHLEKVKTSFRTPDKHSYYGRG